MKGTSETCLGMADADPLPLVVGWLRAGAEVGLVVRRCWTSCWKALWGAASTPRLGAMVDGGVVTRKVTVHVLHNHFELHRPILHQQKRHLGYLGGTKFCLSALTWPRKLKQWMAGAACLAGGHSYHVAPFPWAFLPVCREL